MTSLSQRQEILCLSVRTFSSGGGNPYSSFAEPGSLFSDQLPVLSESLTAPTTSGDRDAPLRADIRTMGSLLGHIIREHHGVEIYEKIEELRALAKNWRSSGAGRQPETAAQSNQYFQELADICAKLSNDEMLIISRAFAHFLAIANSAEAHHRVRLLRKASAFEALPERYDSWCVVTRNKLLLSVFCQNQALTCLLLLQWRCLEVVAGGWTFC
jgi:hypothetical protein